MLPSDYIWLKNQFKSLRNDHLLILKRLEISGSTLVTPELADQVRKASRLSKKIDEQVPDKNVPPATRKTKQQKGK